MFLLPVSVVLSLHFWKGAEADITVAEVMRIRTSRSYGLDGITTEPLRDVRGHSSPTSLTERATGNC